MPSSAGTSFEASRTVEGAGGEVWEDEEMDSWARFRPATAMSEEAMKPEGVRFAATEDSFASSAAMERSRRALALSLFSS